MTITETDATDLVYMYLAGNYTGQETCLAAQAIVDECHADGVGPAATAQALRDFVENGLPTSGNDLAADLIGRALSSVDWHTLAADALSERK